MDSHHNVKKGLTIIPVSHVDDVLAHALLKPLTPIEWPERTDDKAAETSRDEASEQGEAPGARAH